MVDKRILILLFIGTMSFAMEREKEREKGKEKEPPCPITFELPKYPTLVEQLCPPTPSTPLSARKVRALSMTAHQRMYNLKAMPALQQKNSRRHSLEAMFTTESEFNLLQKNNMSLFDILEMYPIIGRKPIEKPTEIQAWIDIAYSLLTTSPLQDVLQEKKYSLCKFIIGRMEQAAKEEGDPDRLSSIKKQKKIILDESKEYYTNLYMQNAVLFMRQAKTAYSMAKNESDQRKMLILYNAAAAFCKEAKDYYDYAKRAQADAGNQLNNAWSFFLTIISKIKVLDSYPIFEQKWRLAGHEKNDAQKIMSDVEINEKKIVEKEQKSNTPRTRTSKFTMDPKLKKADTKKLEKIIKKLKKQIKETTHEARKKKLEKTKNEFVELRKSKEVHEYYKRIMEYKITKLKKQNIQLLTQAERALFKSSKHYREAFVCNPSFTLIVAIQDTIDRIDRVHAKKKTLVGHKIRDKKLNTLKDNFQYIKREIKEIINPIYQEEVIGTI